VSTRRRFYVERLPAAGGLVRLAEDQVKHIRVLRLVVGASVRLFDADGQEADGVIKSLEGGVECEVALPTFTEQVIQTVLLLPLFKVSAMETAVRMVTEVGIDEIRLVQTERCVVKGGQLRDAKMQRLTRIVREASRQCERGWAPKIRATRPWMEVMHEAPSSAARWVFSARATRHVPLVGPHTPAVWFAIGPEGGFSDDELTFASGLGFETVGLGPPVLRAETACAVATALVRDRLVGASSSED